MLSAGDRKSTRLNSSHLVISYAVFCLKKKKHEHIRACHCLLLFFIFFFFNDTATTEIYTLSLQTLFRSLPGQLVDDGIDRLEGVALLLVGAEDRLPRRGVERVALGGPQRGGDHAVGRRSEEHTSELQSPCNLVCRLLLEKKKT